MKIDNRQDQQYLKTLTVLYVEDDGDTRKQFTDFLSRPVGTLITAVNGIQGLEAFKKHRPDIVITDIKKNNKGQIYTLHEMNDDATPTLALSHAAFLRASHPIQANCTVLGIGLEPER